MEKTGCKIICVAPTTLAVKGLMMMSFIGTAWTHSLPSSDEPHLPQRRNCVVCMCVCRGGGEGGRILEGNLGVTIFTDWKADSFHGGKGNAARLLGSMQPTKSTS